MYYKVAEAAQILGVSRVSIYNKVNQLKSELKPFTKKIKGVLAINEDGIELLKKSFDIVNDGKENNEDFTAKDEAAFTTQDTNVYSNEANVSLNSFTEPYMVLVDSLQSQIDHLKSQIEIKDKQIDGLTVGLHQAQALTNNQQQNDVNRLLLEDHFKNIDDKLAEFQDKMQNKRGGLLRKMLNR